MKYLFKRAIKRLIQEGSMYNRKGRINRMKIPGHYPGPNCVNVPDLLGQMSRKVGTSVSAAPLVVNNQNNTEFAPKTCS